jgi:hypothetical protein
MLILICVSSHRKKHLHVAYTKVTEYLNDTIIIGFVLFTQIGFLIFTFMYRSYMVVLFCQNRHKCQHNIYMHIFFKVLKL